MTRAEIAEQIVEYSRRLSGAVNLWTCDIRDDQGRPLCREFALKHCESHEFSGALWCEVHAPPGATEIHGDEIAALLRAYRGAPA